MSREIVFLVAFGLTVVGCPSTPPPVTPGNDASDSAPPPPPAVDGGPVSFEQGVCNALAASGCKVGASPTCAAAIAATKIPGGFIAPWAACVYSGANPTTCSVPCR
jgi:hypothetical protein